MTGLQVYCAALAPNKLKLKSSLEEMDIKCQALYGERLRWDMPGMKGGRDRQKFFEIPQPAPELVAMFGTGSFFEGTFRNEYLLGQENTDFLPEKTSQLFRRSGLIDPEHRITVYGVSPFVILVNRYKLGSLPMPKSWENLLAPDYRRQIVVTHEVGLGNIASLCLYRMFGEDGLRAFQENVLGQVSPVNMTAMSMENSGEKEGGICIAPWFFAKICPRPDRVVTVWPKEGALAFPIWLTAQKNISAQARMAAEYLTGDAFAGESFSDCLPTVNAVTDELMEKDKAFYWPGWDFFRQADVGKLQAIMDSIKVEAMGK